ncbi:MAG: hypothetical protein ABSG69_04290 [Candidatus Acidiferrum sp.]|jgi:hypothetical protein
MAAMFNFLALLVTTLLALGIAVLLDWLLLRAAFGLMQPPAPRAVIWSGPELVRGTRQLIRAYAAQR